MSQNHPYMLMRISRDRNKEIRDAVAATRMVKQIAPNEGIIQRLVTLLKNGEKADDARNIRSTQELKSSSVR